MKCLATREMEAGPPETGCRTSLQTARRCVGLRIQVVSGSGKGGESLRQVRTRKANESEPLMRRRKGQNAIETRIRISPGTKPGRNLLTVRVMVGVEAARVENQALVWNVGTERPDGKGEARGEVLRRASVPMQDAGADRFAVAMKPGNAGIAKEPACPASSECQPGIRTQETHEWTGSRGGARA